MAEEGKDYALQGYLLAVLQRVAPAMPFVRSRKRKVTAPKSPRKKHQIGRERPHFFGFQPPKKFVGALPPTRPRSGRMFFPRAKSVQKKKSQTKEEWHAHRKESSRHHNP
jgi:hypothetical protein